MRKLKTLEDAWAERGGGTVYVVAASPEWEWYDPLNCPAPIRDWIAANYPEVGIERLESIEGEVLYSNGEPHLPDYLVAEPMFLICFDANQAKHFEEAWNKPPLHIPDQADDFFFVTCDEPEALADCGYEFVAPSRGGA